MAGEDKPTIRLIFKGLMVFHHNKSQRWFEAGMMRVPEHEFKITVLTESKRGKKECTIVPDIAAGEVWDLHITNPGNEGIYEYRGNPFDRKRQNFGWIIDLESREFHGTGNEVDRRVLSPVIVIPHGDFYMKNLTRNVKRKKRRENQHEHFGRVAQMMGVDINVKCGHVSLVPRDTEEEEIFRLDNFDKLRYKITFDNRPKNPHVIPGYHNQKHEEPHYGQSRSGPEPDEEIEIDEVHPSPESEREDSSFPDHFQFYYNFLRINRPERFHFDRGEIDPDEEPEPIPPRDDLVEDDTRRPEPVPDPAFCPFVLASSSSLINPEESVTREEDH